MSEIKGSVVQRLTAREELFALRVFEGSTVADAYRAAYITSSLNQKQIESKGNALVHKPHVEARINKLKDDAAAIAGISKATIIREMVDQAFVDPGRIVYTKTYCCRYCHGFDYQFQWKSAHEFAAAIANYNRQLAKYEDDKNAGKNSGELPPEEPNDLGGYEFNAILAPDPHCPKCDGEGEVTRSFVRPTSQLSPVERRSISSISNTKYGVKVELQPRTPLLKMIGEALGLFDRAPKGNGQGDPGKHPETPENISKMTTEELAQLKGLLMKSLMTGDNSDAVDVEARTVPPASKG